jgi:hypothetical protein
VLDYLQTRFLKSGNFSEQSAGDIVRISDDQVEDIISLINNDITPNSISTKDEAIYPNLFISLQWNRCELSL